MEDTRISAETVLAALEDIRLPPDGAGGFPAELLVMAGIGLALAVLLSLLLGAFFPARPAKARVPPMAARVAALAALPDTDRAVALLRLIRAERPDAMPALRPALYTRDGGPGIPELEAVLLAPEVADA